MAFDYGSIDLGITNPFKKEGAVKTVRGIIVLLLGVFLLFAAAKTVRDDAVAGWILILFAIGLLGSGIAAMSMGITALMRYFVGRNHPTSLAYNFSQSQSSTAKEEFPNVFYTGKSLVEMLMGRKNLTFVEPVGFMARIVHSIFSRLTYMPYPVRNLAQVIFAAWLKTIVALAAYLLVLFVSLAGFAGEHGKTILPVYSFVLVFLSIAYLAIGWQRH